LGLFKVVGVVIVVVLEEAIIHCRRCSQIANTADERTYIVKNVLKIEHYVIAIEYDWWNLKFKCR